MWTHLNISSPRNKTENSSQLSQNGIVCVILGLTRPYHAITAFLAISFPPNPLQLSHFGTLSPHPLSARPYPSKASLARGLSVSSSFNQALAQFMLYLVRRLSFRLHREIDAANNPSRGGRRRHCSVVPAAPLRRGMEGEKEHPGT